MPSLAEYITEFMQKKLETEQTPKVKKRKIFKFKRESLPGPVALSFKERLTSGELRHQIIRHNSNLNMDSIGFDSQDFQSVLNGSRELISKDQLHIRKKKRSANSMTSNRDY